MDYLKLLNAADKAVELWEKEKAKLSSTDEEQLLFTELYLQCSIAVKNAAIDMLGGKNNSEKQEEIIKNINYMDGIFSPNEIREQVTKLQSDYYKASKDIEHIHLFADNRCVICGHPKYDYDACLREIHDIRKVEL